LICSFGGTFDPVHLGHIAAANAASRVLGDVQVNLILSARPSHRDTPDISIRDRLALLNLACADYPRLAVDERECFRSTPSYTVDTLLELGQEYPGQPLVWVIGLDAYHYLPTWHRWQEVLELAHLLVLDRVGFDQPPREHQAALAALEAVHQVDELPLAQLPMAGCLCKLPVRLPNVSATQVRADLRQGYPVAHLLPAGVSTYIRQQGLYQPTQPTD